MQIDDEAIRRLAELMAETGLTEIEVAEGDRRLRVSRAVTVTAAAPGPALVAAPTAPLPASHEPPPSANPAQHPGAVKSPMVGTCYLQAEPGAAPFIEPGKLVKAGDTLVIIEAMKVMNPIKAPRAGTVTRVLVKDSQPVEFGEPLLILE